MSNILAYPATAKGGMLHGYSAFVLDNGPENAQLHVFTNTRPANGATPGVDPAVIIVLAKPSGSIVANKLVLEMDNPSGYMATASGVPTWGRLYDGNGDWAGDADAGGASDDVLFKLASGTLYAGGSVLIGTIALG